MSGSKMANNASHPLKALGLGVLGSIVITLVLLAFMWPTKTSEIKDLPVGIAGPEASVAGLLQTFEATGNQAFDFVQVSDRDEAIADIQARETLGAIVISEQGAPEVLTAPAANSVATQMLNGVATQLQAQVQAQAAAAGIDPSLVTVAVTPVVPLSENDATGAGLMGAAFPMMFGGMIGGILVSVALKSTRDKVLGLLGISAFAGLLASLVLVNWFNFLPGNYWMNAAVIGMSILATASFISGLHKLIGYAGVVIGAITTMLIANPISSATTPVQALPGAWGEIGQFFVPGASNWLLRSVNYFPDASDAKQWLILAGWVVLGAIFYVLAAAKTKKSTPEVSLPAAE